MNVDLFEGLQLPDFRVLLPELDGPPQSGPIHQSGSRFLHISKSINCTHIQRLLIILHSSFIVIDLAKLLLNDVELSYQVLDVKVFLASLPRVKVQKLVVEERRLELFYSIMQLGNLFGCDPFHIVFIFVSFILGIVDGVGKKIC